MNISRRVYLVINKNQRAIDNSKRDLYMNKNIVIKNTK